MRLGRKAVIWVSFLGVAPFALALPHVGLTLTAVLAVATGLVMSSAFLPDTRKAKQAA